jgi:hypothetical protein
VTVDSTGEFSALVDCGRIGLPQAELAEYVNEASRLALRTDRDEARDLAGRELGPEGLQPFQLLKTIYLDEAHDPA